MAVGGVREQEPAGAADCRVHRVCTSFPNGKYKDQVDGSSGAFNKLATKVPKGSCPSFVNMGVPAYVAHMRMN